jgi:hypothetical protein
MELHPVPTLAAMGVLVVKPEIPGEPPTNPFWAVIQA